MRCASREEDVMVWKLREPKLDSEVLKKAFGLIKEKVDSIKSGAIRIYGTQSQ